jgi:hypothetical protein
VQTKSRARLVLCIPGVCGTGEIQGVIKPEAMCQKTVRDAWHMTADVPTSLLALGKMGIGYNVCESSDRASSNALHYVEASKSLQRRAPGILSMDTRNDVLAPCRRT